MPRFSAKIRQNWISPELHTDCLMDFVFAENNLEINITVLQTIGNILNVFCNLFPFSACQLNYIILFYQFLQKGLMEVIVFGDVISRAQTYLNFSKITRKPTSDGV